MLDEVAATEDNPSRDPLVPNRRRNSKWKTRHRGQACDCAIQAFAPSPNLSQRERRRALSNHKLPFAAPLNPMTTPPLPEQIELHRDRMWRRDEELPR